MILSDDDIGERQKQLSNSGDGRKSLTARQALISRAKVSFPMACCCSRQPDLPVTSTRCVLLMMNILTSPRSHVVALNTLYDMVSVEVWV